MTGTNRSAAKSRFLLLDLTRLVAAMGVLLFHFTARESPAWGAPTSQVFPGLSGVTVYGYLGVQLFFVISGFVIFMSVDRRTPAQFIASRVGRIFPAYWFAVVATAALLLITAPAAKEITWTQVIVNLTMLQTPLGVPHVDGVYWTLWVELVFYAVIFLLMLVRIKGRALDWCLAIVPTVAFALSLTGIPAIASGMGAQYAPYFAGGMCLYLMHRDGIRPLYVLLLVAYTLMGVWQAIARIPAQTEEVDGQVVSPLVVGCIIVGIFVLVALITVSPLKSAGAPWMALAGALTYPLYLIHQWWGWWVISIINPVGGKWLALACAITFTLAFAYLIERLIERPLRPMLRKATERALRAKVLAHSYSY